MEINATATINSAQVDCRHPEKLFPSSDKMHLNDGIICPREGTGLAPLFPGCKLILPGEGLTQPQPAQEGARRVGHSPAQPEPRRCRGTEGEEGRREEGGTRLWGRKAASSKEERVGKDRQTSTENRRFMRRWKERGRSELARQQENSSRKREKR